MQFTTKIPIPKSNFPIDYSSKVLALGSCFAVNMGEKFNYFKFNTTLNPFGILFHPLAIHQIIKRAIEADFFTEKDFFFHNERWHCFEMHSDLSSPNKESLLQNVNQLLVDFKNQIIEATHILITYGTSWVYREKALNKIVANCHKVLQSHFKKELLSIATIEKAIQQTIQLVQSGNQVRFASLVFDESVFEMAHR